MYRHTSPSPHRPDPAPSTPSWYDLALKALTVLGVVFRQREFWDVVKRLFDR